MEDYQQIAFQKLSSIHAYTNNMDYHMHNFYEIYLILEGDVNLYIKNSCYHITSSSVAVINSLDPHKLTNNTENSFTRIYFHIPDTFTSRFSDQKTNLSECFNNRIAGNNVLLLSHLQKDYIIDIFNKMTQCKDNKHNHFGVNLLFDTYVIQLLIYINNLYNGQSFISPSQYSSDVAFITEYIDSHILENITLDSLADMLSRDKYYLSHKFKKETDTTIFHYLIMARISKAKQLLSEGMNVTETCYNSGFNDYSNFITTFKKITGYTPKKFQKIKNG